MEMSTMHKTLAQMASGRAQDAQFETAGLFGEPLWKLAACGLFLVGISRCYGWGRKGTGRLVKSLWTRLFSALTSMPRTEGGLSRFTYWKVPKG